MRSVFGFLVHRGHGEITTTRNLPGTTTSDEVGLQIAHQRCLCLFHLFELGAEVGSIRRQANGRFVFLSGFLFLTKLEINAA